MIISHQHKFMFFAIPKTGTHSVRFALREHLSEKDLEQVALFKSSKLPFKKLADIPHGHLKYTEVEPYFKPLINEYYKFAFVRNPYDRLISYYFFIKKTENISPSVHRDEIKKMLSKENLESKIHLLPQFEFLVNENRQLKMDFIGKVENFNNDLQHIFSALNLGKPKFHEINSSKHLNFMEYYDDELLEMVKDLYKKDFELFNYLKEI
ncbi:MAG: sulfotransferase family 2 domain-containing protein [Bacteroidetes bacterium]|nr:sulfotransferase family 2 domain-containing protein [Bacteroidota bacterium]